MTFLDTGYLIALARSEDALHQRAAAWGHALRGPFLTTEYVLCEFMNAMSAPEDRPAAHLLLGQLRTQPRIDVIWASPVLFEGGARLHESRNDKRWSLTDCISFTVMEQHRIRDALTHYHHFEQAGFRALLREEPPQ
jgi:uncharacterized protein